MDSVIFFVIIIAIFIILGVLIWIIVVTFPKNTVPIHGPCTNQTDCSSGLFCSGVTGSTANVCLSGLNQPCTLNSDCGFNFLCLPGPTGSIKSVCSNPLTVNNVMPLNNNFNPINIQPIQFNPQFNPQFTPQFNPQFTPQFTPQFNPQFNPPMQPITSLQQVGFKFSPLNTEAKKKLMMMN